MDPGHEWGDDFILYLHQARCWIRGGMQELARSNQACMDQSDGVIGPYLYPQGFPVLMSLPMRGIDIWGFMGLKIFNYSIFIRKSARSWCKSGIGCTFFIWIG